MAKLKSLIAIRERIENWFAPDLTFWWDDFYKCYIMRPVTELGQIYVKRVKGVRMKNGFLVSGCVTEEVYESALKCGLCIERIDKEN